MDDLQNSWPQPAAPDESSLQPDPSPAEPEKPFVPMEPDELPSAYHSEQLPDETHMKSEDAKPAPSPTVAEPPRADPQPRPTAKRSTPDAIFHIEVEKIKPNPHQPRRDFDEEALKELAASIQEYGILQPLVVSKIERDTDSGTAVEYQLIAGERRLRAAQMLGWERVPVIIRSTVHRSEQLEMAIVENLQRENLSPIETARAYAKLQDEFGLTQREVASRLGKSRESVANTLRLLNLPSDIQDAVAKNQINESQGRLLLMIEDPKEQHRLFEELLNRTMTVRELKTRVHANKPGRRSILALDPTIKTLEEELCELLGANVKIEKEKAGDAGKIIITFYSPEEIEGIIQKLHPDNQSDSLSV